MLGMTKWAKKIKITKHMKNRFLKLLNLLLLMTFLFSAGMALAADDSPSAVKLYVKPFLGGIEGYSAAASSNNPGLMVGFLYKVAMTLVGLVAFGSLVYAGILRTWGAVGNPGLIKEADERIKDTLWGILLLAGAAVIFNTINPQISNVGVIGEEINRQMPVVKTPTSSVSLFSSALNFFNTADDINITQGRLVGTKDGRSCPVGDPNSISGSVAQVCLDNPNVMKPVSVDGNILSAEAAGNYKRLAQSIQQACQSSGFNCGTRITSTLTGEHVSQCHKPGNFKSGTCADFVITGCKENSQCISAAASAIKGSPYVATCLNEYEVKTEYTTGGHMHCNF